MRILRWCAVLTCGAVLGCGPRGLTPQQARVEQGMVEARVQAWSTAFNNGNVDSVLTFYEESPDLIAVLSNGRRAEGYDDLRQVLQEWYDSLEDLNFVVPSPRTRVVATDVAVVTFRHSTDLMRVDGEQRDVFAGYVTQVWTKHPEEERWRILTQQISRNPTRT